MAKTVVGLMDSQQEAEQVISELVECGFDRSRIGIMASDKQTQAGGTDGGTGASHAGEAGSGAMKGAGIGAALGGVAGLAAGLASLAIPGIGPIIAAGPIASALAGAGAGAVAGGLIGGLTHLGVPEEEAHYYAEGVRRGGTLVTVETNTDAAAQNAADLMRKHGAVDMQQRAANWKQEGWSGRFDREENQSKQAAGVAASSAQASAQSSATGTTGGERVIPVVEEELKVGKREVERGGVKVTSRVTEQPVEERVNLKEEHARVERVPVDRPASASDADLFREQSVEIRETAEEPVIAKETRVIEEVHVGKEQTERQQTVRDTVRRTDVDVHAAGSSLSGSTLAASSRYQGPERRRTAGAYTGAERRHSFSQPSMGR